VDLGGRIIRAVSYGGRDYTIAFSSSQNEPDPATTDNYVTARRIFDNALRVKNSFNFEIENISISDAWDVPAILTTSVMAGDPIADVAFLHGHMKLPLILDNIILPLDSINLPNSDILGAQVFGSVHSEIFGERWSFGPNTLVTLPIMLGVNLDIINAIDAPNPVDLYNRGQWTWDVWLYIMRLATGDTTGNGVVNRFGIAGTPAFLAHLITANDGRMVSDDFQYYLCSPNTLEALEFGETIFREGLWECGGFARPMYNWWTFQRGNSAFFTLMNWMMLDDNILPSLTYEFAAVPFPLGPSNTSGIGVLGGWNNALVFPRGSDWDQAEILMVVEEFLTWHGGEPDIFADPRIVTIRNTLPTEDDVQRVINTGRHEHFCYGVIVQDDFAMVIFHFADYFISGEKTALQAVEAYRVSYQELLDDFFSKGR